MIERFESVTCAAVFLLSAGCATSQPASVSASRSSEAGPAGLVVIAPEMQNRPEMYEMVQANYPPELRQQGIEGRVVAWVRISEDGEVIDARVAESSGYSAMDQAALQVAREARFSPVQYEGSPTAVWVQIPISFIIPN